MMNAGSGMRTPLRQRISMLLAIGGVLGYVAQSEAKSYGSHSHSYSSHSSSHSYSSGGFRSSSSPSHSSGGKSYSPGGSHSYGSGQSKSGSDSHSYTSSKSYGSGGGPARSPSPAPSSPPGKSYSSPSTPPSTRPSSSPSDKGFAFDQAAARAQKEQSSKRDFTQYKDSQNPRPATPAGGSGSYNVQPPPVPSSSGWSRTTTYIPTRQVIITRPVRIYGVFNPYYTRPWIVYNDPYSSLFWWWLLDRSLDDRAWWAYHHRYDMDPARYDALLAADQQLSARVADLEAQQAARDPSYTPPGLDRDLMYSDHYVSNSYSNRPTFLGVAAFRILIIGGGAALCFTLIWLIWIKRWQTAT